MKKKHFLLILLISISTSSLCQVNKDSSAKKAAIAKNKNMFGIGMPRGLTITSDGLTDGYILYAVPNSAYMYLINRKGEVVHEWKGNYGILGAYLQDDGSIIANSKDLDFPVFVDPGETGRLQKISWDSKMLWDFEYANETEHIHHDFTVMPNGHILTIAFEAKSPDEVMAAGRAPNKTPKAGLWPDKIVEIEPVGKTGGKVVWEWHSWDHMIQDYDSKKANYGKPSIHPELVDLNIGDTIPPPISEDSMDILRASGEWMPMNVTPENMYSDLYHTNAISYNVDLDQIAFSNHNLNEIFIIDHSTTTKEAVSHKGGRYGKGGDYLYRWGNPQNYRHGDFWKEQLFGQHHVHWIEKGKPGAGDLMLFNNNVINWNDSTNCSAIFELSPLTDKKGNYLLETDTTFGPAKPMVLYIAPDSLSFYSGFIGGAEKMENGNTFINEGARGRFFEVTKEGKIVWEFLNPYHGDIRKPNGDLIPPVPLTYITFRATFVPSDHLGLINKNLQPLNPQPAVFVMPSQGDNK
ncbi:MAG: aryl-sulfate sulfotransferase [Ginsengibacter sp.]